jgi:hypothetical protein
MDHSPFKGTEVNTDAHGDKRWYLNGELHRDGGPAVEWVDGGKEWYRNGEMYRREFTEYTAWYCKGARHRDDGPAIEYPDGSAEWWHHGRRIATVPAAAFAVEDEARADNKQRDIDKADAINAAKTRACLRTQAPHMKLKPGPRPLR